MSIQNLNFSAAVRDIFDINGNRIAPELGRGVYRDDTDDLLAVCGPNFVPVQHNDIVGPILDGFEKQGYTLEERSGCSRGALYDLQGKKGAFVSAKLSDGGAVMRTDIILGDFITPRGALSYMGDGEDTNFFRVSIINSHNSKLAVRANTSYLRLICMNGMTQPHFSAGAYGKHTQNFNLAGMHSQIGNAMGMMSQDAERFGKMAKTPVTPQQAEVLLKNTIAKLPNKANGDANHSESLVKVILERFRVEDKTAWGLYNAITWWQTHTDYKANSNRLTAQLGREGKVSQMLKTKEWRETAYAI